MSNLTKAIVLATQMHHGMYDKGGNPYILHPLRLMLQENDETSRIVAVLHDIVEDTGITFNDLHIMGFSDEIVEAIDCLTRRKDETYMDFIRRCKQNDLARGRKIKDIRDNMDLSRIPNPTERDYERLKRYEKAIEELEAW